LVGLSLLEPELQDISNPPIFKIINYCGTLQELPSTLARLFFRCIFSAETL
jgi:hypothetical protein